MTAAPALSGGFADPAREAARAFRGALEAMARPGRIERVAGVAPPPPLSPAAAALLLVLCDTDTPLHLAGPLDSAAVRTWLAFHTGAPMAPAARCAFAAGEWAALGELARYPAGTPDYPDRSATLIVEVAQLDGPGTRLTGPGIATEARLPLPDAAALAANAARYPCGVDLFLTCGHRLAALPRSTRIHLDGAR